VIEQIYEENGGDPLRTILLHGFKGFLNMNDEELFAEVREQGYYEHSEE
jgi:hypothetical protein